MSLKALSPSPMNCPAADYTQQDGLHQHTHLRLRVHSRLQELYAGDILQVEVARAPNAAGNTRSGMTDERAIGSGSLHQAGISHGEGLAFATGHDDRIKDFNAQGVAGLKKAAHKLDISA